MMEAIRGSPGSLFELRVKKTEGLVRLCEKANAQVGTVLPIFHGTHSEPIKDKNNDLERLGLLLSARNHCLLGLDPLP